MKNFSLILVLSVLICSCKTAEKSDAYGNFEADEIIVSSEGNGKLMRFSIDEGSHVEQGTEVGYIDTVQLNLKRNQLCASIEALRAKMPDKAAQIDVIKERLQTAQFEQRRLEKLVASQSATQKQLDDMVASVALIERELLQLRSSLSIQERTLLAEAKPLEAQIAQIDDQIAKSIVVNPIKGTVLTTFVHESELMSQGKPLYKIADVDNIILKAYIGQEQLPELKLADTVRVFIDIQNGGYKEYSGSVEWVSDKAEFTPKVIQTKDERINLVYAFKVRVKNDGAIKIGMPGEVRFKKSEL